MFALNSVLPTKYHKTTVASHPIYKNHCPARLMCLAQVCVSKTLITCPQTHPLCLQFAPDSIDVSKPGAVIIVNQFMGPELMAAHLCALCSVQLISTGCGP